jgi:prepilin-type N-terminal cleavage/methylation domain-containing protein/prepilin-type processing-associated H-X9-DG protein
LRIEKAQRAFTLIELLVVIAILAILAAMLLPSLTRAKLKAQGIACLNRHRQLALAWRMYSDDNHEVLLYASGTSADYQPGVWMGGNLDFDPNNASNWDPSVDIYRSPMWPYCANNQTIFKCPSDFSYVVVNGQQLPRVRTMVMNLYLGGFSGTAQGVFDSSAWCIYYRTSDLNTPGPSQIFVFLDERSDAINWGNFYADMAGAPTQTTPGDPSAYRLADMPGTYHGNACGFSFADGHSEIKKWLDGRTCPPLQFESLLFNGYSEMSCPGSVDIGWLQPHSTYALQ